MTPKEYYRTYLADNNVSPLNGELVKQILSTRPNSILEFGCGTGKNLKLIQKNHGKYALSTKVFGIDVSSISVIHAVVKNDLPYIAHGDQDWLSRLGYFDVVFTCSVLDHIENVAEVIKQMQRIAKHVFLAETNDVPGEFYFPHDYESHGFKKLDFAWKSDGDGATYHIWHWQAIPKGENGNSFAQ